MRTALSVAFLHYHPAGPQPAWDNMRGEEFSERGQNFLNYVQ